MIGKYAAIGALVLALLTFLLPLSFFTVTAPSLSESGETDYIFTVLDVLGGAEGMKEAMVEQTPELEGLVEGASERDEDLEKMKFLVIAPFGPMLFVLLFVLIGLKRFGRGLGVGTLIFALIGLALWALLTAAASEGDGKASFDSIGFYLLGFAYVVALIGGILAIAKPEPKPEPKQA